MGDQFGYALVEMIKYLFLIRKAELHSSEGNIITLHQALLTDSKEYGTIRMTVETVGDETCSDLVVHLVLHLVKCENCPIYGGQKNIV